LHGFDDATPALAAEMKRTQEKMVALSLLERRPNRTGRASQRSKSKAQELPTSRR